jgi:L-alanine-DL-glutamate epimerase-like enolase superfamily enzyme
MLRFLETAIEKWPIAGHFTIARGSRTEAVVVVAVIREGAHAGRGESVPYARYGETAEGTVAAIAAMAGAIGAGLDRDGLRAAMPAGAARNAIDCALLDLEAKRTGRRAAEILGLAPLRPLVTAYTLSLGPPEAMEAAARGAAHRPLLKVKLGGAGDVERIAAVRRGAPDSRLVVDANEAWSVADLAANIAACAAAGVELIEQPLPAGEDEALAGFRHDVPICADESMHLAADVASLVGRYDAVNVKLDKTGGVTEGLAAVRAAKRLGLGVMAGCMVGTSLAMAPALLLAQGADFVDLDGPLLLARDRDPGLRYDGSLVYPPEPGLWG